MFSNKNIIKISIIVISINLLIFIPLILLHHYFVADDFQIFSVIQKHPLLPISINKTDPYFLLARPISYAFLWFDYKIWGINPIGMKMMSLIIHEIYIIIFLLIINRLLIILKSQLSIWEITLIVLCFSFFPDNLEWIVWISNITELLSALFYITSLYFLILFLTNDIEKKNYLYGFLISFSFSILAKQTGIHLPILIIFLTLLFGKNFAPARGKKIMHFSLIGIIPLFFLSVFNYLFYPGYLHALIDNIWKKPFTALGIIIEIINPVIGEKVYSFFIFHQHYALIILILILLALFYYIFKSKVKLKNIFIVIIALSLIFYPRLFSHGETRINTIIFFWFFISILIWIIKKPITHKRLFLTIILLINLASTLYIFHYDLNFAINDNAKASSLIANKKIENRRMVIVITSGPEYLPYQVYFIKHKNFGCEDMNILPYTYMGLGYLENKMFFQKISTIMSGNRIIVNTLDKNSVILRMKNLSGLNFVKLINLQLSSSNRNDAYRKIELKIEQNVLNKNYSWIYFNGEKWKNLN